MLNYSLVIQYNSFLKLKNLSNLKGRLHILNKIKNHEALFIFLLTASGYLCTYLFQWGKFHYYSIPRSFIEINSNTIVSTLVFIFILTILTAFYLSFTKKYMNLKDKKKSLILNKKKYHFTIQFLLIGGIVIFVVLGINLNYNPSYFLMALVLWMLFIILKHYDFLFIPTYVAFTILGIFAIGYLFSENESTYLIMKDQSTNQSYVVLDAQGGKAIVAKVDLKKNAIHPEYQLVKFETDKLNEHTLNLEKIENLEIKN